MADDVNVNKRIAQEGLILKGVVGSTSLGTNVEGQDDRDEMGICVEPVSYVAGLGHFEQYIYRSQPEGVRSSPGDLDLTVFSLRKFCRLAVKGNPSVLILLYLPEYIHQNHLGRLLVQNRGMFFSREAGFRFLGYLTSQLMKLTGERSKKVSRPDLVERYGYDTKFAMHALRLGYQGLEYLETGELVLPMVRAPRLLDIREGRVSFDEALEEIRETHALLQKAAEACDARADWLGVSRLCARMHLEHWGYV